MKRKQEGSLPSSRGFCNIEKPNVILLNMKFAEDKDGIILRLIETGGIDTVATMILPFVTISEAYLTNLVEENEELLNYQKDRVIVPIKAFGIATLRIKPKGL